METTSDIKIIYGGDSLHKRYESQSEPQPCFVELDLEHATLDAGYNPEIGNAGPESVYHGRALRWTIPCLKPQAVQGLLEQLLPLAEVIYEHSNIASDRNGNRCGQLGEEAEEASEQIAQLCEASGDDENDVVKAWNAADWYAPILKNLAKELEITGETTDQRIAEIAQHETEIAEANIECDVLHGAEKYLRNLRDSLRDG